MIEIVWITIALIASFAVLVGYVTHLHNQTYQKLVDAVKIDPATAFSVYGRITNTFVYAAVAVVIAAIVFALTWQQAMKAEIAAPIFAAIVGYVAGAMQSSITTGKGG